MANRLFKTKCNDFNRPSSIPHVHTSKKTHPWQLPAQFLRQGRKNYCCLNIAFLLSIFLQKSLKSLYYFSEHCRSKNKNYSSIISIITCSFHLLFLCPTEDHHHFFDNHENMSLRKGFTRVYNNFVFLQKAYDASSFVSKLSKHKKQLLPNKHTIFTAASKRLLL